MVDQGIVPLTRFVAALQPGERNKGLFWAACRASADGLDTTPLVAAAQQAGLSKDEAQAVTASAAEHIAKARAEHERINAG